MSPLTFDHREGQRLDYATASGVRCGGRPIGGIGRAARSDSFKFFGYSEEAA